MVRNVAPVVALGLTVPVGGVAPADEEMDAEALLLDVA